MTKDEALKLALEALEHVIYWDNEKPEWEYAHAAITAIKAALLSRSDGEAKDEKQKPVNIKKVAEEHGINLPTEFVPKHDESKAAIQSLTDQCAALIWERDELQKQMWRSEKQEPVAWYVERQHVGFRDHGVKLGPFWKRADAEEWVDDKQILKPLYTFPPQRKPLTDEEILECWKQAYEPGRREHDNAARMARAIEAAHGIKRLV